ncbi:MAG: tetratricopeptide repeat protein [Lachnospiraceae bacterium]|nr:tetratricopeptide repeat protein [Lachnospiraceae bacterium]
MGHIRISLFGNPKVEQDGKIVSFPYRKADGLLYYLCVKKTASRDELISLLWGDEDEVAGKKKLRDAIYQIKRALGKDVILTRGNTTVILNGENVPDIDYDRVTAGEAKPDGLFLHHFFIKNCYEYEEWADSIRDEMQNSVEKTARAALDEAAKARDTDRIQEYSNLLLRNDPYNENLYYEIMNLYAENGSYTMAIRVYQDLKKLLKKDMDMEPSPRLRSLFRRIFNMKENAPGEAHTQEKPFFGRKKELFEVSGLLDQAAGDRMNCIAVEGQEGAGKTAFLEVCGKLASGRNYITFTASCYRQGEDFFLMPWRDIFLEIRRHLESNEEANDAWKQAVYDMTALFSGMLADHQDGHAMYAHIEAAYRNLLAVITTHNRVLLCFDEIQWMDALSFQLLVSVLRAVPPDRLKLICTYDRSAGNETMVFLKPLVREDRIRFMTLAPFTNEESDELILSMLPALADDPAKRQEIRDISGGNALFLTETVNMMRERGDFAETSDKLNFMMRMRREVLTEQQRELIGALSVFPGRISVEKTELLMRGTDRLQLLNLLEQLQEKDMIRERLAGWNVYYRFVHPIFQRYIYENMSEAKRQAYHRILAEDYETRDQNDFAALPKIAYHYVRCNEAAKAYPYQIRYLREFYKIADENFPIMHSEPSEREDDIGRLSDAEQMLRLAQNVIRLEGDTDEIGRMKAEMHYILGRHDIATGEYDSGVSHIRSSIALSEKTDLKRNLLSCYRQMVYHAIQTGNIDDAEAFVGCGLSAITENSGAEYATFLRLKGWCLVRRGEYEKAKEALDHAIALFRAEEKETPGRYGAAIAACLKYQGDIYRIRGRYEEALPFYEDAVREGRDHVPTNGTAQIYSNIGQVRYYQERYAESYIQLDKARDILETNGYYWGLERTEAYLALVCLKTERREEAKSHYDKALKISGRIKNPVTEALLGEIRETYGPL